MITTERVGQVHRLDPHYNIKRLRVTLNFKDTQCHQVLRSGKFLLTGKQVSHDGKVTLRFENQFSESGSWELVGRNGVIRVTVDSDEARQYMEGGSYSLYLFTW